MPHFAVGDVMRKDSTASDVLKDGSISEEAGEEIVGVNQLQRWIDQHVTQSRNSRKAVRTT